MALLVVEAEVRPFRWWPFTRKMVSYLRAPSTGEVTDLIPRPEWWLPIVVAYSQILGKRLRSFTLSGPGGIEYAKLSFDRRFNVEYVETDDGVLDSGPGEPSVGQPTSGLQDAVVGMKDLGIGG